MFGVPPYAVTAIHTHAEYPPHCTSQRLLRVWGHATGRPRAAYHTRTPERAPDRGGKRGVPWLHTLCGVRYAMPHRVSTPPEQGSPRYGGDRIAKCLTKSFLVQYLPVYDVIQPFVYDATPHEKVPIVRYVHPLIDTQRDLLDNTMTHDVSPRARARAHSLLLSAQGMTINAITKIYQVDRDTISTWIRKWEHDGPESLHDTPRSGRPPKLTPEEQTLAIASIKEEPRSLKQVVERFTTKTAKRLSISSLKRLAKRARLRWKRVRKS